MNNMPEVKIGVVAVSRDCFPESLSVNRRKNLMKAYTEKYGTEGIYECPICIVESEIHMVQALEDIKKAFPGMTVLYDKLSLGVSCHIGPGGLGIGCSCRPKRITR